MTVGVNKARPSEEESTDPPAPKGAVPEPNTEPRRVILVQSWLDSPAQNVQTRWRRLRSQAKQEAKWPLPSRSFHSIGKQAGKQTHKNFHERGAWVVESVNIVFFTLELDF